MRSGKNGSTLLTEGSILGKLFGFAVPLFLGNLFQQLYNTCDSLIVGNFVGSEALAAVSSSGSLIFLLVGLFNGIAMGAGVVIARYFGARDPEHMRRAIHSTVFFGIVAGLALTVLGILLTPQLLRWMGTPEAVLPQSITYFRVYFAGALAVVLYNVAVGILQAVGDSKHPLYYLMISSGVNVVLDLVFVGALHWGASGAAAATVIAQGVAFFSAAAFLFLHKEAVQFDFRLRSFAVDREQLGALCRLGIPSVVQQFLITISITFVNAQVNAFDVAASAVDSVGGKLNMVANIITGAISTATATMIAQSFGARKMGYDSLQPDQYRILDKRAG